MKQKKKKKSSNHTDTSATRSNEKVKSEET